MITKDSCPSREIYQLFITGKLDEANAQEISAHLESCSDCEETICALERQDTLAEKLHDACKHPSPESEAFLQEPQYGQLLHSLQGVDWTDSPREELGQNSFNEYEIVGLLGQGGMGTVYRALHKRLKRPVALKVVSANRLIQSEAIARFEREMVALGKLSHPNIVQANDAGEQNGQHYLVMELVEGKDLSRIIKEAGRLKIADAALLTIQAAQGLQYAHQNDLIHRDIKPSNLMLSAGSDGVTAQVKILDLGLARALGLPADDSTHLEELSTSGQILGTLEYMAPEQVNESGRVDKRTDIYALGATLYKLLTGEAPFAAQAKLPMVNRLLYLTENDPLPIREKRSEIPKSLAKVVHRMLARLPEDRFASAQEVIDALRPFCAGADLKALLTATPLPSPSSLGPSSVLPTSQGGRRYKSPPRSRVAILFGGLAVSLLLGIVFTIATRHGTVTVACSNGALPQDMQIAVIKGGDEIALLQSENHWSLKIANGEYELRTAGGNDRFQLREKQLTIHRLQNSVVTIDILPLGQNDRDASQEKPSSLGTTPMSRPQPLESLLTQSDQTPLQSTGDPTSNSKPFRIVRQGEKVRDFSTLPGTFEDLRFGDVIEVHTNERLQVRCLEPITKPLSIRAGNGYRPMLDFPAQGNMQIQADLTVEGCDLDIRNHPFPHIETQATWEFRSCRIWGDLKVPGTSLKIVNSILVGRGVVFSNQNEPIEAVFDNCLIRHLGPFLTVVGPTLQLTVNDCSFHSIGHGCTGFFHDHPHTALLPNTRVSIHAKGNVFNYLLHYPELIPKKFQPQVSWTGKDNLFVGNWQQQWEEVEGEWKVTDQGLSLWNKWLPEPEVGSRELPTLAMEWGRIQRLPATELLDEVKQVTERVQQQTGMHDLGPDWSLVGPGDAYVRALRSNGQAISAEHLRPERLVEGPITLLHRGAQDRGFMDLKEAIDTAVDGDIIEFRTDSKLPSTTWTGDNRLLTLRAAPGYLPEIGSIQAFGSDRLIIEGLVIQYHLMPSANFADFPQLQSEGPLLPGAGSIVRIANCQLLEGDLSSYFSSRDESAAEIVNCQFAKAVYLGLRSDQVISIRNCVFRDLYGEMDKVGSGGGKITVDHCTFFRPETTSHLDNQQVICSHTAVDFQFTQCLFTSGIPQQLFPLNPNETPTWRGDHNVYIASYSSLGFKSLKSLNESFQSDLHSIELNPWEFDPAQWRILRNANPDYKPKADGTDYGARIDALIEAMK